MTKSNTLLRKKAKELAKRALYEKFKEGLDGKEMIITSTKINKKIKTEFFGYKLVSSGVYSVGQRIDNPDGTTTTVEDILN
jgi:flagellar hook assembly protein FlgD